MALNQKMHLRTKVLGYLCTPNKGIRDQNGASTVAMRLIIPALSIA